MNEMREIRLPSELCAEVEKKFAQKFGTLEELLVFILRDLSSSAAAQMDQLEQQLVDDRLRELGYL